LAGDFGATGLISWGERRRCAWVLCYLDGSGDGPPVVLLHSINAAPSAAEVRPLFEALRGQRAVVAPDLPGFGRSERADRDYGPAFFATAILELLDALKAGTAHVLALSTTAEFAARAAREAPERFASLVLVSPTGLGSRVPPSGKVSERIHGFLKTPYVGSGLYRLLRTRPSVRYFLGQAFADAPPPELVDYARRTAAQPGASHAPFHFLSGKLFTPHVADVIYKRVTVPTLVLYDRDPNVGFERLEEVLAACPNWRAVRIPGTLGLPHFEQPVPTQEALEAFWAQPAPAT
jgi:pimeloyl-ACP methyl ester carboxylesterase